MLPKIEIDFKDKGAVAFKRIKKEAINPIYKVDQELKLQVGQMLEFKNGEQRDYLKIKVKDSCYTPSLGNAYTITHLELAGQIEEVVAEADLIKMIKN